MKTTKLSMFIQSDIPPTLGFNIDWHDNYLDAINSSSEWSGYFKASSSGGKSNIMVFGSPIKTIPNPDYPQNPPDPEDEVPEFIDVPNLLPISELDMSNMDSFSTLHTKDISEIRISGNQNIKRLIVRNPLSVLNAIGTNLETLPLMGSNSTLRIDNSGLSQESVDVLINQLIQYDEDGNITGATEGIIIENNGNSDVNIEQTAAIENLGGKIWENNSGICKFQTTADTTISFIFFINAGADVDWYVDGELHTENSNNATFNFTDNSIKTIEIRREDVSQGRWLVSNNKSLTGTFDISAMTSSSARIDFSGNPNLTKVILPRTNGVFDQLMGFGSGITDLRLDKLPNLINSANIQIRLGDCPNLNTDQVALNALSIDENLVTGRQLWFNGTTPTLDPVIKAQLQANNWVIVE